MILDSDRAIVVEMVELKIWKLVNQMRLPDVVPTEETKPLLRAMKDRQKRDDLHHAPCCPANHFHYTRLVLKRCTCDAAAEHRRLNPKPVEPPPILCFEFIA